MANALYDNGRESFLAGLLDWDTDVIKTALIDTGAYTVNLATDTDYRDTATGDVPAAAKISESGALGSKTTTAGVADAADVTHSTVSGASVEAIVIWEDDTTVDLLTAYIDTATGLPVTPNGGDITIQWDSGANKIFKL